MTESTVTPRLTCRSAMKRKKALAALLNCEYRKRGRNVRTLYLAVLKTIIRQQRRPRVNGEKREGNKEKQVVRS